VRLTVDYERCQGHTLCAWAAPAVIRLADDDGRAIVDDPEVPPEHEEAVRAAVANCPENALVITEG
jgi:ferredoxin